MFSFWIALIVGMRVVRQEGGKSGRVVKQQGGKDGRVMRWQGGRFLVLFKSEGAE